MKSKSILGFILFCSVFLMSCTKEYGELDEKRDYFFKRIGTEVFDGIEGVQPLANGNILIGAFTAENEVMTMKAMQTNAYGQVTSTYEIGGVREGWVKLRKLSDGTVYFGGTNISQLTIFDKNGNFVKKDQFLPDLNTSYYHQYPIVDDNGRYWMGMCRGLYGSASNGYVIGLDEDLNYDMTYDLDSGLMGGKVLSMNIDRVEHGKLWVSGMIGLNPFSWSSVGKVYAGVVFTDTVQAQAPAIYIVDRNDDTEDHFIVDYVHTSDGGLIQLLGGVPSGGSGSLSQEFRVICWDKSRLIKWDRKINWENRLVTPNAISLAANGDILIAGGATWTMRSDMHPFVLRMDEKNGNEIQKKVLYRYNNAFAHAIAELPSGDIIIAGLSTEHVKGSDGADAFILKTDATLEK